MKRIFKGPWVWIILAVVGVLLALQYLAPGGGYDEVPTSKMESYIAKGQVKEITFIDGDQTIEATLDKGARDSGSKVMTHYVMGQQQGIINMVDDQIAAGNIEESNSENPQPSFIGQFLPTLIFFALIIVVFLFLMNNMQGGGRGVMQFAKSKAKLITKDMPKTTFNDVAGCDEAIEELGEIKEFLQEPAKFQAVGAKIPKGVLLYGQPGTGKTLLARAVAGEAGVPFYSISGSDFVEMFVGVGASRVRDLFEQAKANSPSIVFMDEIDAVGRHRGAGLGGGHDEREQTLNQLLVEMDGFDIKSGVILIAATNRPDILDPALLRPGRFDRQIVVDRPDLTGRTGILKVHTRGKPMSTEVDVEVLARRTPGFTGADLANVVNEAALLAARFNRKEIGMWELEEAIDRVVAGPQRRSRVISDKEKKVIAYHEAGHALVSHALPHADPVHKVSIISRGQALGYTLTLPTEDKFLVSRSEMIDELAMIMGGRVAEEIVFDEPTTGAQNDIQRATVIAKQMVTQFGMSDLGPLALGQNESQPFLGRDFGHVQDYSDNVASQIDSEVHRFVDEAYQEAKEILTKYRDKLDLMVERLLEKESLAKEEVSEILAEVAKQSPEKGVDRSRLRRQREEGEQAEEKSGKRKRLPRPAPKPRLGEI